MKDYTKGFQKVGFDPTKVNSTGYSTCPECSHTRKQGNRNSKCLSVNKEHGHYKCHHCGFKGRADSNEWLDKQGTQQNQEPIKAADMKNLKPFQTGILTEQAISFLNTRGISKETAKALNVAFEKGTICFNYYKKGFIVGAKYRLISKKRYWQHAGCKKYLYNLDNLKGQSEIIIVEGEFDVLAIYQSGFKHVGSVSQGAPNAGSEVGSKLQCLDNSIDYIKNAKRVVIWSDNDANGVYLQQVLIERFGSDRCAIVTIPKDLIDKATGETCKDANSVLINFGSQKVKELIDKAKDTPIAGVRTLDQAKTKMYDIFNNGYRKGVQTGVRELQGVFSFYKTWWCLWHGIPQSGKSAFINFLMMCMSVTHGWKWAVFSPEHYPEEDFYLDMIELLTGKSCDKTKTDQLSQKEFETAMDFVGAHFFFVYPEVDKLSNSGENVLKKIKELKLSKGIDGFLIDPYNQLVRGSDNVDVYLEKSLSNVDVLCKTHNLVGNIVAHPRTLYKETGEEDYKKSTPYQIAGGAMWYNKAYTIGCVHRPHNQSNKLDTIVEIDIQKVKSHKRAGSPKCIDMNFDRHKGWYRSLNGECILEGAFASMMGIEQPQASSLITTADDIKKESTFTEKMEAENQKTPLDPFGDPLPF
jgi:twinkle protein